MLFSSTAYQTGFGTARFKNVCGLSEVERQAARNGELVIFDCGRGHINGNHGITLRKVVFKQPYYYNSRCLTAQELKNWKQPTEK